METLDGTYLFISPELEKFLIDNEISVADMLRETKQEVPIALVDDPATQENRQKEPVTLILASTAVIAALTPVLKEVIRRIARRDPVIRDRMLVPVETRDGTVIRNADGEPILHWVDKAVGLVPEVKSEATNIKGIFGMEITLGGEEP